MISSVQVLGTSYQFEVAADEVELLQASTALLNRHLAALAGPARALADDRERLTLVALRLCRQQLLEQRQQQLQIERLQQQLALMQNALDQD
ncbi:cell division protein ZapA [Frateuria aurantia]